MQQKAEKETHLEEKEQEALAAVKVRAYAGYTTHTEHRHAQLLYVCACVRVYVIPPAGPHDVKGSRK